MESLVGYGPCRAYTCLSVNKLFQMALPGDNKSHSSGKWLNCFSFSGYEWPTLECQLHMVSRAFERSGTWCYSVTLISTCVPQVLCLFFDQFSHFLEGGRQVVRGTVLFVNRQRPARFCCLRGLMFYFKGMCLILRHVECLGI